MAKLLNVCLSFAGVVLAAYFFWGFWGFFQAGSSGPPAKGRGEAVLIAGPLYLVLLIGISWGYLYASNPMSVAYGSRAWTNLKITTVALLLCFPAAFFFVGFIAPPFIVTASALALLISAFLSAGASDGR